LNYLVKLAASLGWPLVFGLLFIDLYFLDEPFELGGGLTKAIF
jgi:hypothetical protein